MGTTAGIVLNIVAVVGIVILNKSITANDGYEFMIFLSFLHFVSTSIGTRVMLKLKVFQEKQVPIADVMPVAIGSLLSVAFMNLNLQTNSVGIYQLSKLACIPVTLIVQYFFYQQTITRQVALTLVPLTIGLGIATVYDMEANFLGTMYAAAAVFATALGQIFTSSKQKQLGCDALQLLHVTSPIICVGMLIMCPIFDDVGRLIEYEHTAGSIFRIALSCVLALAVNVSNYVVLGRTSPLTYQVLGHAKTILILVLGFLVFNKTVDGRQALGIAIAMVGVIAYTDVKSRPGNQDKPAVTTSTSTATLAPSPQSSSPKEVV